MNLSSRLSLVAATLVFLSPALARSQNAAKKFEVGVFLPYTWFDSGLAGDHGVESDTGYGFRVGYHFTERFSTELSYSKTQSQDMETGLLDASVDGFALDFLTNFRPNDPRNRPYFGAGFGRFDVKMKPGGDPAAPSVRVDEGVQFLAFSGGYRRFFKPWLGVRSDARFLFSNDDGSFLAQLTEARSFDFNFQVSAGMTFVFPQKGRFAPTPKAAPAKP